MTHFDSALSGLPDPETQGEFYADVVMKRFFAWLIDEAIILFLTFVLIPLTFFIGLFFFPFLWMMVALAYRVVTVTRKSATLGMRLMSIELRNFRGERFDLLTAFLHTILYIFMLGTLLLQAASVVVMMTSARGQGLHDLLLGTTAINRAAARR